MINVIEVLINSQDDIRYCSVDDYDLKIGTNIIVNTDNGLQYAVVKKEKNKISTKKIKDALLTIVRVADEKDQKVNKKNTKDSIKALKKCEDLIKKYKLNMSLIDANYSFDRKQLLFRFVSDERVDFRKLAKELANFYKTRIELRQIGVRDKAKMIGGCGQCGKELCCKQFLTDFESVSINMVKNQNLSLNPNKINGVCGRLLCCMNYENDNYKEYRKNMPTLGKKIETDQGEGKVISIDLIKQTYRVDIPDKGIIECEVSGSNK